MQTRSEYQRSVMTTDNLDWLRTEVLRLALLVEQQHVVIATSATRLGDGSDTSAATVANVYQYLEHAAGGMGMDYAAPPRDPKLVAADRGKPAPITAEAMHRGIPGAEG
jgi:hypothetical protein